MQLHKYIIIQSKTYLLRCIVCKKKKIQTIEEFKKQK